MKKLSILFSLFMLFCFTEFYGQCNTNATDLITDYEDQGNYGNGGQDFLFADEGIYLESNGYAIPEITLLSTQSIDAYPGQLIRYIFPQSGDSKGTILFKDGYAYLTDLPGTSDQDCGRGRVGVEYGYNMFRPNHYDNNHSEDFFFIKFNWDIDPSTVITPSDIDLRYHIGTDGYCDDNPFPSSVYNSIDVNIIPSFPQTVQLNGENLACQNETFNYSIPYSLDPNAIYRWEVTGGEFVDENGNTLEQCELLLNNNVNVRWTDQGIGTVSIACPGLPLDGTGTSKLSMDVNVYGTQTPSLTVNSGLTQICAGVDGNGTTDGHFSITMTNGYDANLNYEWINPYGVELISENTTQGGGHVWHFETQSYSPGGSMELQISLDCGILYDQVLPDFQIMPSLNEIVTIKGPRHLCAGNSGASYYVEPLPAGYTYLWTLNTTNVGSGNSNVIHFNNITQAGTYTLGLSILGPCNQGNNALELDDVIVQVYNPSNISSIQSYEYDYVELETAVSATGQNPITLSNHLLFNPCEFFSSCGEVDLVDPYLRLKLDMGENNDFGLNTFNANLTCNIKCYDDFNASSNPFQEFTAELEIDNYNPEKIFKKILGESLFQARRIDIEISEYGSTAFTKQNDGIRLIAEYGFDKRIALPTAQGVHVTSLSATALQDQNRVRFDWQTECMDFTNYEFQLLHLYNVNEGLAFDNSTIEEVNIDWTQALCIETRSSETEITLTLAEGTGTYIWRVRPISNYYEGGIGNDKNWGEWSYNPYNEGTTNPIAIPSDPTYTIYYDQFDEDKNWIYSRSFVIGEKEDALRIGEGMTYANGILQGVASQSYSNSNGHVVTSQSIYDYEGRPSIQTLPAPVIGKNSFSYEPFLFTQGSGGSVFEEYGAEHFDTDDKYRNPELFHVDQSFPNASHDNPYYYYENPDALDISSTEGYPFSRTLFDNQGRVKEQGGLGKTHRIKEVGADDARTTKTFYSGTSEDELLRIFGDEAPLGESVLKIINIDPNDVMSGSYVDKAGRTLATFLIDSGTNTVTNVETTEDELIGLTSKLDADFIINQTVSTYTESGPFAVKFHEPFFIEVNNTQVNINYIIDQNSFEDDCNIYCSSCDYNISIYIHATDIDNPMLDGQPTYEPLFMYDVGPIEAELGNCIDLAQLTQNWAPSLDVGNYIISAIISTNNTNDDTGNPYLQDHLNALEDGIDAILEPLFFNDNTGILEVLDGIQNLDNFYSQLNGLNNVTEVYDGDELTGYDYAISELCQSIFIPFVSCDNTDLCADFSAQLALGPLSFNNYLKDDFELYWADEGYQWSSVNAIYENNLASTNPLKVNYGYAFAKLLINMSNEIDPVTGENIYPCEQLLSCWEAVKAGYGPNLLIEEDLNIQYGDDQSIYRFAMIDEFIGCTGKNIIGFTNSGNVVEGTVLDYNNTSTEMSWLTHAYAFFNYTYNPNGTCEDQCLLFDENQLPDAVCDPGFQTVNQVIQNTNVSVIPTLSEFHNEWSWCTNCNYTAEQNQEIWRAFETCVSSFEVGPSIIDPSEAQEFLDDFNETFTYECFSRCNRLMPGFRASLINEYHENGIYIIGEANYADAASFDVEAFEAAGTAVLEQYDIVNQLTDLPTGEMAWAFNPTNIWNTASTEDLSSFGMVTTDAIECLVQAMVQNCKDACDFNIDDYSVDANGNLIDQETFLNDVMAFQEAFTSPTWEVQLPNLNQSGTTCPDGFIEIQAADNSTTNTLYSITPEEFALTVNAALDNSILMWRNLLHEGDFGLFKYGWNLNDNSHVLNTESELRTCDYQMHIDIGVFPISLTNPSGTTENFFNGFDNINTITYSQILAELESKNFMEFTLAQREQILQNIHLDYFQASAGGDDQGNAGIVFIIERVDNPTSRTNGNVYQMIQEINPSQKGGFTDVWWNLTHGAVFGTPSLSIEFACESWGACSNWQYPDCVMTLNNIGMEGHVTDDPSLAYADLAVVSDCYRCTNENICFKWSQIEIPEDYEPIVYTPITCTEFATNNILNQINSQIQSIKHNASLNMESNFMESCIETLPISSILSYDYATSSHHFTLYYYDRAGNLMRTVPPEGVHLLDETEVAQIKGERNNNDPSTTSSPNNHSLQTDYRYNSLNQLVWQSTPDGGISQFWYDDVGRLRFSQNAEQLANGSYSYTKYDPLSRIIEVGESSEDLLADNFLNPENLNSSSFPDNNTNDVTFTYYSEKATGISLEQRHLLNRVSYSIASQNGVLGDEDDIRSIYSYDPHGNVEWLIQDIPELGQKVIAYDYDLISGNVLQVSYQAGELDQFYHKYAYDEDNRLTNVYTSRDAEIWDRDAAYEYYIHGPLKRVEIGEDQIQGIDYYYNLHGWLKALNHPDLDDVTANLSGDGETNEFAKDAFGMALSYYQGDFIKTGGVISSPFHNDENGNAQSASILLPQHNLYNGNIAAWTSRLYVPTEFTDAYAYDQVTAFNYRYDELNRIRLAQFNTFSGNAWNASADYRSEYSYDANGNLEQLSRNGHTQFGSALEMDDFTYAYAGGANKVSNQLMQVSDNASYDANYGTDIDSGQDAQNYHYDEIGNLEVDEAEGINLISWTPYGKIESIDKTDGNDLSFRYGAMGNRTIKSVFDANGLVNSQYYVRDASGNVMAIYQKDIEESNLITQDVFRLKELPLYGSSRLGVKSEEEVVKIVGYGNNSVGVSEPTKIKRISDQEHIVIGLKQTGSGNQQVSAWLPLDFENGNMEVGNFVQSSYSGPIDLKGQNRVVVEDLNGIIKLIGTAHRRDDGAAVANKWNWMETYDEFGQEITSVTHKLRADQTAQTLALQFDTPEEKYGLFTYRGNKIFMSVFNNASGAQDYELINAEIPGSGSLANGYKPGMSMALVEDHRENAYAALFYKARNASLGKTKLYVTYIKMDDFNDQITYVIDTFDSSDEKGDADIQISPDGR